VRVAMVILAFFVSAASLAKKAVLFNITSFRIYGLLIDLTFWNPNLSLGLAVFSGTVFSRIAIGGFSG